MQLSMSQKALANIGAQANLCVNVINVEKGAAKNGVTLWSIFSRNGTQQ